MDHTFLKILRNSIEESSNIHTQMDAINYMAKYINTTNSTNYETDISVKINYIKNVVLFDILPHVGKKFVGSKFH